MSWLCVPPSDQEANSYVVPPSVCGVVALMELLEPTTTVRLKGAVELLSPTTRSSPAGSDWKFSTTGFGSSRTLLVSCKPSKSVAVRRSSRYEGYSWSGAVNVPLATLGKSSQGCSWQVSAVAQWC